MYLNQTVKFQSCLQGLNNSYGEPTYSTVIRYIRARKQVKMTEVADKEGNIHKSTFEVYTYEAVNLDDKLDDRIVLFTESYASLGGKAVLYRSLTV